MKKLIKLAAFLKKLGLKKEYILLSTLIKDATPMEGVVPMKKYEPVDIYGDDEDEEENHLRNKDYEETQREEIILRDRRQRLNTDNSKNSEELSRWYKALKEIGDSIILIPFDKQDVDNNEEIMFGLSSVFGIYPPTSSYETLYNKVNMLYGNSIFGDVDKLKKLFPGLWSNIARILSQKELDQRDVVFMLYNQENSPVERLAGFSKDPFFIGHDTGHIVFDGVDGDFEFKYIIIEFIKNISKLYVIDDDIDEDYDNEKGVEDKKTAYSELEDIDDDSEYMKHIEEFFSNPSGPDDSFADIFQQAASGTLTLDIPDDLSLNFKNRYVLAEENRGKADLLKNQFLNNIKKYMNSNFGKSERGIGPLSNYKGSVILHDI